MNKKSIILLSGGLDSIVALGLTKDELNVQLALTFDYGQTVWTQEYNASKYIADYYGIKHEVVKLPFYQKIINNNTFDKICDNNVSSNWLPNRNSLFLNIAAAYADKYGYTDIIFGANKQEAENFPDNTIDFINSINNTFQYSTIVKVKVSAPLINYNKNDIVNLALKHSIPIDKVWSCYVNGEKNCGICESCLNLKNALIANNAVRYIEQLFKNEY